MKSSVDIANNKAIYVCDMDDVSPNVLGEFLRHWAFTDEGYGCYSNFTLKEGWTALEITEDIFQLIYGRPSEVKDENWGWDDGDVFERASAYGHDETGIVVAWYWDGDGTLAFELPSGRRISNSDCEKDNEWDDVEQE